MLIGVHEETWPWPVRRDSLPTTQRPVGAADGHAAARAGERNGQEIRPF